jgi:deoxyhypusine synthase
MKQIDFAKLKTYSLSSRKSKVNVDDFCSGFKKNARFIDFFNGLPDILAGKDFKKLVEHIVKARKNNKHVIVGMGAHSIKVGLSPLFVQVMKMGVVTGFAMNGACLVHDFEIAFAGKTSEDVDSAIKDGTFGMAEETGKMLNDAIKMGVKNGVGIGRSVGRMIYEQKPKYFNLSILGNAYKLGVPVSVHVALGTDIIHFHKNAEPEAIGRGTMIDFKNFTSLVAELSGGVFINIGSAVIIPEIFLKAITIARNLGHSVNKITTANFDFIQHYRPLTNVVRRPTSGKGTGIALTGHHEIMVPLLFWSVMEKLKKIP